MSFIKSPLRYPGGKSRAANLITSLMPNFDEYREPFVGGGSVFLMAKQQYPDKHYWINDLYFELYNLWNFAQQDIELVISIIENWFNSFNNGKLLYQFLNDNFESFNNFEKAAGFFVYNRITFSGTTLSGGYSEGAYKGRFTQTSIDRLRKIHPLLINTKITNDDYSTLLTATGDNVFIYLDPPYYTAEKSALYGKNGHLHKGFNHQKLAQDLKTCQHKWLVTYDNSDYIKALFADFAYIHEWDLSYGMKNVSNNSHIGKELFISNYLDNDDAVYRLIAKS